MKYKIKISTNLKIALASSLVITLCSCGDKKEDNTVKTKAEAQQAGMSYESVSEDYIANLKKMRDELSEITDSNSAISVIPELTKIGFAMKKYKTDIEKLGPAAKNAAAKMKTKYGSEIESIASEIGQTMQDLKKKSPAAFAMVEKVMKTAMK